MILRKIRITEIFWHFHTVNPLGTLLKTNWTLIIWNPKLQAWNSNDSRIAKRMALLVFTDFICWAPIAFFALTAAGGVHLINLEQAKVFTVFILPLNSCCNPFLYAILTKQFKKDCVMICKAIEESRVTRGIGRCRHSSNFSNRYSVIQCCQLLMFLLQTTLISF